MNSQAQNIPLDDDRRAHFTLPPAARKDVSEAAPAEPEMVRYTERVRESVLDTLQFAFTKLTL